MRKIILDTNFLMIPYRFRVDIFSEFHRICSFNYKLFVFEETINELRKVMQQGKGIDKKAAKFALKLISLKNIGMLKSKHQHVDSDILGSIGGDTIIATQDIALKKELIKKGSSLIILRQKKHLQVIEGKQRKSFRFAGL